MIVGLYGHLFLKFILSQWKILICTSFVMLSQNSIEPIITILLRSMFLILGKCSVRDLISWKKSSTIHNSLIAQSPKMEDKNAGNKKSRLISCSLMLFWFRLCVGLFKPVISCLGIEIYPFLLNLSFQRP